MLSATSTQCAPWYVIPADRKWFAGTARPRYSCTRSSKSTRGTPRVDKRRREALVEVREQLMAQAPKGAAPDPIANARDDGKP